MCCHRGLIPSTRERWPCLADLSFFSMHLLQVAWRESHQDLPLLTGASWRGDGEKKEGVETVLSMKGTCMKTTALCTVGTLARKTGAKEKMVTLIPGDHTPQRQHRGPPEREQAPQRRHRAEGADMGAGSHHYKCLRMGVYLLKWIFGSDFHTMSHS